MADSRIFVTKNEEETERIAKTVVDFSIDESSKNIRHVNLLLYGELGSGKTTLSKGLIKALGIMDRVVSPTFVIMRTYQGNGQYAVNHLDLYRLEDQQEIRELLDSVVHQKNTINIIEWSEKIPNNMHIPQALHIECFNLGDTHKFKMYE